MPDTLARRMMTHDIRKLITLIENAQQESNTQAVPTISKPKAEEKARIVELTKLAANDEFVGVVIGQQRESNLRVIHYAGDIVGLCWPQRSSDGRYCMDLIFVDPKYQGKGIATRVLKDYYANKKGRAYIEPANTASIQAFTKAGFKKKEGWSKQGVVIPREFNQYLKD
jgi:RimJ/RimL family protein N-acetyltransferase